MSAPSLSFTAVPGIPEVCAGDDLAGLIMAALRAGELELRDHDVLVLSQKIVSKAQARAVDLGSVAVSARARELAATCAKDPRLVELILRESSAVLRAVPGVLIVRHRLGLVCANAGIDQSNLDGAQDQVLLLPEAPDQAAADLQAALEQHSAAKLGVLIADSFGRPWRMGVCGVCIGCAGIDPLLDQRGRRDRAGRELAVTQIALADQLCAGAGLLSGEADEGLPVIRVRGLGAEAFARPGPAARLIRPLDTDLFR